MNDLDFVRDLRADVPGPSTARLRVGRVRLTAAIQMQTGTIGPRSHEIRRVRPRAAGADGFRRVRPTVVLSAGTVAVIAVVAALIVALGGGPASHHRPGEATIVKPVRLTLAAKVLRTAAITAAARRAAEPAPDQWFYTKTVGYQFGQSPATTVDLEWGTFDGADTAYYQGSELAVHKNPGAIIGGGPTALDKFDFTATPRTAYQALASLPSDPAALLAVLAAHVARLGPDNVLSPIQQYAPTSRSQVEFDYLVELLWNATDGEPPAAEASVYEAMAEMPGVSVQQGITDAAGHTAIGVSDNNGIDQLLLDPRTYAVIGTREISTGTAPTFVASKAQMVAGLLAGLHGIQLRQMEAQLRTHENQMWQITKAHNALPWPPRGAVVESDAIAVLKPVSGPGLR